MSGSAIDDGPWLAIDTATDTASIALARGDELLAEDTWTTRRRHTVQLAPRVSRMLQDHDLRPVDLRGIAVAIGPGSYTGLRIGVSLAKGMALGADLDVVGVPTLDILAASFSPPAVSTRPTLWAVLRAGRGRVVAAAYPPVTAIGDGRPDSPVPWPDPRSLTVWTSEELIDRIATGDWVAGELDGPLRALVHETGGVVPPPLQNVRRAGWCAWVGRLRATDPDRPSVADLAPEYAR